MTLSSGLTYSLLTYLQNLAGVLINPLTQEVVHKSLKLFVCYDIIISSNIFPADISTKSPMSIDYPSYTRCCKQVIEIVCLL